MTEQELKEKELKFEMLKLEYEQTAQRYENIYKAIWQIFSYMTALTAAIVAFGANSLPLSTVILSIPLPLFFWLFAIYTPMDFYGHKSRERLAQIEENINTLLQDTQIGLRHFSDFKAQRQFKLLKLRWRVSHAIWFFAIIAAIVWVLSLAMTVTNSSQLEPKSSRMEIKLESPVQVQTQDSQVIDLENELTSISNKLNSIESLLHQINTNSTQKNAVPPQL